MVVFPSKSCKKERKKGKNHLKNLSLDEDLDMSRYVVQSICSFVRLNVLAVWTMGSGVWNGVLIKSLWYS